MTTNTATTKSFRSTTDMRLWAEDRKYIGTKCTILETKDAWIQGKTQQVAQVQFADGARRVWPVSALVVA